MRKTNSLNGSQISVNSIKQSIQNIIQSNSAIARIEMAGVDFFLYSGNLYSDHHGRSNPYSFQYIDF